MSASGSLFLWAGVRNSLYCGEQCLGLNWAWRLNCLLPCLRNGLNAMYFLSLMRNSGQVKCQFPFQGGHLWPPHPLGGPLWRLWPGRNMGPGPHSVSFWLCDLEKCFSSAEPQLLRLSCRDASTFLMGLLEMRLGAGPTQLQATHSGCEIFLEVPGYPQSLRNGSSGPGPQQACSLHCLVSSSGLCLLRSQSGACPNLKSAAETEGMAGSLPPLSHKLVKKLHVLRLSYLGTKAGAHSRFVCQAFIIKKIPESRLPPSSSHGL